jgi:hypothetical protein
MDTESDACALGDCEETDWELESNAESFMGYEEINGKSEASWARDRQELEASKLSFMKTMQKQNKVDQSIRLLLQRLEQLPSQTRSAKCDGDETGLDTSDCDTICDSVIGRPASCSESDQVCSGKNPQRIAAVAQLLRKGVNMAGASLADEVTTSSTCAKLQPSKKSTRTCVAKYGANRCTQLAKPKRYMSDKELRVSSSKPARRSSVDADQPPQESRIVATSRGNVAMPTPNWAPVVEPQGSTIGEGTASIQSTNAQCIVNQFDSQGLTESHGTPTRETAPVQLSSLETPCMGNSITTPQDSSVFVTPCKLQESPAPCDSWNSPDPFARWPHGSAEKREALGAAHTVLGQDWRGWTMQTSVDGEVFYYHEETNTSQWRTPRELLSILGEWAEATDETGNTYWANDLLNMSCWADPRCTANIFQAAYEGDMFFVQLYVRGNGNLDVKDSSECTALHYACASSSEEMAGFLLENGASPDSTDASGGRPLHWACRYSHSEAARLLLQAGADPDRQDSHGDAPLHQAASVDCTGALQWLIKARASPKLRTWKQGAMSTAREVAQANGAHSAAAMLQAYESEHAWQAAQSSTKMCVGDHQWPVDSSGEANFGQQEPAYTSQRPTPVITRPSRHPSDVNADEVMTPMKAIARVAKPVLRGVQWLANHVIPVDDTRTKAWELGRGAPTLESNAFQRFVSSIPRGALEQVVRLDRCLDDPPGFDDQRTIFTHTDIFENA